MTLLHNMQERTCSCCYSAGLESVHVRQGQSKDASPCVSQCIVYEFNKQLEVIHSFFMFCDHLIKGHNESWCQEVWILQWILLITWNLWKFLLPQDIALHIFDLEQFCLLNFLVFIWYVKMELVVFAMSNVTWIKKLSMYFEWEISYSVCCLSLSTTTIHLFTHFYVI